MAAGWQQASKLYRVLHTEEVGGCSSCIRICTIYRCIIYIIVFLSLFLCLRGASCKASSEAESEAGGNIFTINQLTARQEPLYSRALSVQCCC